MTVAIFICSSDATSDVGIYHAISLKKYWKNCPFQIHVGGNYNTCVAEILSAKHICCAPQDTRWKGELLMQLRILKCENSNIDSVILFLDDFVLGDYVNTKKVNEAVAKFYLYKMKYLMLKKVQGSLFYDLMNNFWYKEFIRIPRHHPYYSSLQVAIWDLDYLVGLLERCSSIWHFEQLVSGTPHFSVKESLFCYKHIVEKGKWNSESVRWCLSKIGFFNAGLRNYDSSQKYYRVMISRIGFMLFGYSIMRIKRQINKIRSEYRRA